MLLAAKCKLDYRWWPHRQQQLEDDGLTTDVLLTR